MIEKENLKEIYDRTVNQFRGNYGDHGIFAGQNQFRDYWARDSFYSCLGALKLGERKDILAVRRNLELFVKNHRDGEIPLRIGARSIYHSFFYSLIGRKSDGLHPSYRDDKIRSISTDSNSLFLIVLCEYVKISKDNGFARKHWSDILQIISFLDKQKGFNGLIKERFFSTWMDGIRKKGNIFYSNVLYYVALEKVLWLADRNGLKVYYDGHHLSDLKDRIDMTFFNGNAYIDWVGNNDKEYIETYPNLLAVYFGFASKERSKKIMKHLGSMEKISGLVKKAYPEYSSKYISIVLRLVGLSGYSKDVAYPWMSIMHYVCSYDVLGMRAIDQKGFDELCGLLQRDETVHECYDISKPDVPPYRTLLYLSENPFSWGCSFLIILFKRLGVEGKK